MSPFSSSTVQKHVDLFVFVIVIVLNVVINVENVLDL